MTEPDTAVKAIAVAYSVLLMMPHGAVRARQQALLAACRDALAEETGRDAEEIQDAFDPLARLMRR